MPKLEYGTTPNNKLSGIKITLRDMWEPLHWWGEAQLPLLKFLRIYWGLTQSQWFLVLQLCWWSLLKDRKHQQISQLRRFNLTKILSQTPILSKAQTQEVVLNEKHPQRKNQEAWTIIIGASAQDLEAKAFWENSKQGNLLSRKRRSIGALKEC